VTERGLQTLLIRTPRGTIDVATASWSDLRLCCDVMGVHVSDCDDDESIRAALRAKTDGLEVRRSTDFQEARALELLIRDAAAQRRNARSWLHRLFDRLAGD